MPAFEAQYHNYGYENNGINLKVVFFGNQVSPNSSTEVVYNTKTGKMVTDCLNGGTFNHIDNSISKQGHFNCDVKNYWFKGNCVSDPNTMSSRMSGLTFTGYDNYKKLYDQEQSNLDKKINQYRKK